MKMNLYVLLETIERPSRTSLVNILDIKTNQEELRTIMQEKIDEDFTGIITSNGVKKSEDDFFKSHYKSNNGAIIYGIMPCQVDFDQTKIADVVNLMNRAEDAMRQVEEYFNEYQNCRPPRKLQESDYENIAKNFLVHQDCNIAENDLFHDVIKEYLEEMWREKSEKFESCYSTMLEETSILPKILKDCTSVTFIVTDSNKTTISLTVEKIPYIAWNNEYIKSELLLLWKHYCEENGLYVDDIVSIEYMEQ